MAALLSIFAAVYAFWVLPMNQKAASWHFWLTATGFCLFWIAYYSFSALVNDARLKENTRAVTGVALGWLASGVVIAMAQGIFAANLIAAILQLRQRT